MAAKFADVNGTTLAYHDIGNGVPLVCLHGGMGIDSRSLCVPGMIDVANQGIRVVIPDLRGHGDSGKSRDSDYTHETWVADAHALVRALGLSTTALLGHSYGGFLALEYAVRWPESLSHLILVGTSAGPVSAPRHTFNSDSELRDSFRARWPMFFSGGEKYWSLFERLRFSAKPYNAAFARELPSYDLRARLRELDIPMLLLVGSNDWYRADMEWIAANARQATLKVFERAGHFPFIEAAEEFAAAIASFLLMMKG